MSKDRFDELRQKEVGAITLSDRIQKHASEVKDVVTAASITKLKLNKDYKE